MAAKRQRLAARRRAVGVTREQLAERAVGDVAGLAVQTCSARLVKELDDRFVTYGLRRPDAW